MKWYDTNFIGYKIALAVIVFGSAQTRRYHIKNIGYIGAIPIFYVGTRRPKPYIYRLYGWPLERSCARKITSKCLALSTEKKGDVIWHRFDFPYSILNYWFHVYFGTATYVDYLMFYHLNPVTNPTPCQTQPELSGQLHATLTIWAAVCTLTIGSAARNPNYRGCRTQP